LAWGRGCVGGAPLCAARCQEVGPLRRRAQQLEQDKAQLEQDRAQLEERAERAHARAQSAERRLLLQPPPQPEPAQATAATAETERSQLMRRLLAADPPLSPDAILDRMELLEQQEPLPQLVAAVPAVSAQQGHPAEEEEEEARIEQARAER
jgi:hypothetical protein